MVLPFLDDSFKGIDTLQLEDARAGQGWRRRTRRARMCLLRCSLATASSMVFKDGEVAYFHSVLEIRGAVERWLGDLETHMRSTLKTILEGALDTAVAWESGDLDAS